MITDGKPTCLKIGKRYYKNSFGLDRKVVNRCICLLYTSDAADERSSVDLGGRRIIKKKNRVNTEMSSKK